MPLPCTLSGFLRCHGLPPPQLHEVARATTIASLMYASPSWWGFSSAKDRSLMERLINKLKRSGFLPESAPSAAALAGEADERLFRAVISDPTHVLRKHLPEVGNSATTSVHVLTGSYSLLRMSVTLYPGFYTKTCRPINPTLAA